MKKLVAILVLLSSSSFMHAMRGEEKYYEKDSNTYNSKEFQFKLAASYWVLQHEIIQFAIESKKEEYNNIVSLLKTSQLGLDDVADDKPLSLLKNLPQKLMNIGGIYAATNPLHEIKNLYPNAGKKGLSEFFDFAILTFENDLPTKLYEVMKTKYDTISLDAFVLTYGESALSTIIDEILETVKKQNTK